MCPLVTCEHGGNGVPPAYRPLFTGADAVLASHRGWDPGALGVARTLARALGAPLHATTTTRLLADPNRSARNPRVLSRYTRALPAEERAALLSSHHAPYREAVRHAAAAGAVSGIVLHLAVHSFTPELDGVPRAADVALLYDPRREGERVLAAAWTAALRATGGGLRVRRNFPYLGRSDGLTTWLRGLHPPDRYLGLEIELSHALLDGRGRFPPRLARLLLGTLEVACRGDAARAIFTP